MREVVGGGGLRLVVDPDNGGRVVSLTHDGFEWLAPSTPAPAGATDFEHPGMGGWDEALPTIAASASLPDHGDLWNTAWTVVPSTDGSVVLDARSASSEVALRRTIAATDDGIELRYRASTDADGDRPFLWSAHPVMIAEPGTTFHLPGVRTVLGEYPDPGRAIDVPPGSWIDEAAGRPAGFKAFVRSDALRPDPSGSHTRGADTSGRGPWVTAGVRRSDGRGLDLSWAPTEIPWLGLYWDSGEFSARPVLALEPTNAGTDHANRADALWSVRRDRPRAWRFRVRPASPSR